MATYRTPDGMRSVSMRAWPLAGLDSPTAFSNGGHVIPLASSPSSPQNFQTYSMVYKTNPWVYSAVNTIAMALSRLPLKLYQRQADGTAREVRQAAPGSVGALTTGQALADLLEMPAPGVPMQEFLRKLVIDMKVFGNSLTVIEEGTGARRDVPSALHHTPWQRVEAKTGDEVPILLYTVKGTARQKDFRPDQVMHFGRSGDMDGPLGLSPIASLKYTHALYEAIARHLFNYFKNAARPSGLLKVAPNTDPTKLKLIQRAVEELYTAPENAGRVLVTSGEWQGIAQDPQSSELINLIKLSREEILTVFQVPPPIVGLLERSIQSNVHGLRSQFLRDVCGPLAAEIEGALNAQLIWSRPGLRRQGFFLAFDMLQALKPDITELSTVLEKTRHVLTPQEQRALMGYEALTGDLLVEKYMSVPYMPSGQIAIGLPQQQTSGALDLAKQFPTQVIPEAQPHPAAAAEQQPFA